ncbi:MAG: pyruvate dehydrogenase (acetyl-transferring) E1 component subunit alpha [Planctomycetes bacterium]|nr:pyruvate dehydrogenase (acetyl-transferring) E1 component subunit alpha [Planctomycetota bacterium]
MLSEPSTSRPFDVHGKPGERTSAPATTGRRDLVDPALCRQWLRDMLMIREFENRCMQQYQDKKIGGFCHIYIGQEAIAVGCTAAVRPNDPIVTAYRDHGHALARGMAARHCMAEMFGKIGGCAKGKGGSMHMFDREHHLYGGHGIVGAQIPLGVGLAFACKYMDEVIDGRPNSRVALAFLGDGALNQGAIHEAMNLAGLLDIPCVIICENNGYSMGTSIHRGTTMGHDIISKAIGYGIDGYVVDGMDVLSVYHDMSAIVEKCRRESRPAFVDMRCYRFKGHSMSDPRKYRTPEEENQYASDDPIGRLKLHLEERGELPEAVLKDMQKEIRDEVREAIAWSEASPEPPMSELYHDVFVEPHGPFNGTSLPQMLQGKDLR